MKKRYLRITLMTLVAVIVYQGLVASKWAEHRLAVNQLRKAELPVEPGELAPELDRIIPNAAPLYLAAMELNTRPARFDHVKPGGELCAEAREALEERALTFELLAEAAQRPQCVNRLEFERGYAMRWPNYVGARRMVKLACHEMVARAEQGSHSEAVALAGHCLSFVRREIGPPGAIAHMIDVGLAEEVHQTLTMLDDRYPGLYLPPMYAELERLAYRLDERLVEAVAAERAYVLHLFDQIRSGEEQVHELGPYSYSNLVLYRDELCYLDTAAQIEAELNEKRSLEQITEIVNSIPRTCLMTKMLTPSWPTIVKRHQKVATVLHIKKIYY